MVVTFRLPVNAFGSGVEVSWLPENELCHYCVKLFQAAQLSRAGSPQVSLCLVVNPVSGSGPQGLG